MNDTPKYQGYVIIIGAILLLVSLLLYEVGRHNEFFGTVTSIKVLGNAEDTGKLRVEMDSGTLFVTVDAGTNDLYCVGNRLYKQQYGSVTTKPFKHESLVFLLGKFVLTISSFIISMWAMRHYDLGATDSKGYLI